MSNASVAGTSHYRDGNDSAEGGALARRSICI
jgi:hypothetical protein